MLDPSLPPGGFRKVAHHKPGSAHDASHDEQVKNSIKRVYVHCCVLQLRYEAMQNNAEATTTCWEICGEKAVGFVNRC
jgi:hypothetical protein